MKRQTVATNASLATRSPAMRRVEADLASVATKEVTLTLIGESGCGKEVLARRAHELSPRRKGPFVPINCAAIPEGLLESELFGYERGAFTGATSRTKGKVEAAEGGTLFLDEIGELPLPMQAKLLRFLENRRFMRVGGTTKIEADVRLIFATLRPLEDDVRSGRFRADLFYRLQGITLHVPPLRERRADIAPLVREFVAQASKRHRVAPPRLTRDAKRVLVAYDWPGNVRELRNVVESVCLLRAGRAVRATDLPRALQTGIAPRAPALPNARASLTVDLRDGLDAIVAEVVRAALDLHDGSKAEAARTLGVSVRTIQRYVASGMLGADAIG